MNHKPILIVVGEPYSVFSELIFKLFKSKKIKNLKNRFIFIGSIELLKKQMKSLNYKSSFNLINKDNFKNSDLKKNSINIINVKFIFKKTFDKISSKSKNYIIKSFEIALKLLQEKKSTFLINGPISKKHFLKKNFLGITEYLSVKSKSKKEPTMLIFNKMISVCPITTHLPLKKVAKNITKQKIIIKSMEIFKFYKNILKITPRIAVLGLNPHCETIDKHSEEDRIIKPAINYLKNKKINVYGPFSADTFFLKKNIKKFDVVIGMYHDQVLTPIKTLYKFKAINITLGLPFIRISPDHGPNHEMLGKNKSNPDSVFYSIDFLRKINAI